MTESTTFLTATQAAARMGVKTATVYAYVSRGLLPRHAGPDGRTSRFDPADIARLARRGGSTRHAPSDVTVASELTLIDTTDGRLYYRGVDAVAACRQLRFEEVASWLWSGRADAVDLWRADSPSAAAALMAQAVDTAAPKARGTWTADRLAPPAFTHVLDAALGLVCEHGLTHPALVGRLVIAAGGGLEAAVTAARHAAGAEAAALDEMATAIARAREDGPGSVAASMHPDVIARGFSDRPYRNGDPRAIALLDLLADVAPKHAVVATELAHELARRGAAAPTGAFAFAALAFAADVPAGPAWLVARTAGWIAHALEEQRHPTPYRLRLAYTGAPPRSAPPKRTLDAVRGYLART